MKSTLMHVLELAICLAGSVFVLKFFKLGSEQTGLIIGVAVNALLKFARTSEAIPLHDYVNSDNSQP